MTTDGAISARDQVAVVTVQGRPGVIEARNLTKRYGPTVAVQDLSFTIQTGAVTGFLGPNGAGKSTTMRLILGLDAPTSGTVTVNGHAYTGFSRPLFEVGSLLEARGFHDGRSAYHHLLSLALSNGIRPTRVGEVLDLVGLTAVARERAGRYSLGMSQRLGLAAALLGDPRVLILDEPVNGLDPEGVLWIRTLLRTLADQGRTVLLSSHLMSEMALTADRLLVIGRGQLIADMSIQALLAGSAATVRVRVAADDADPLARLLIRSGASVTRGGDGALQVTGSTAEVVGQLAREHGWSLQELVTQQATLEQRYLELTDHAVDFATRSGVTGMPVASARHGSS